MHITVLSRDEYVSSFLQQPSFFLTTTVIIRSAVVTHVRSLISSVYYPGLQERSGGSSSSHTWPRLPASPCAEPLLREGHNLSRIDGKKSVGTSMRGKGNGGWRWGRSNDEKGCDIQAACQGTTVSPMSERVRLYGPLIKSLALRHLPLRCDRGTMCPHSGRTPHPSPTFSSFSPPPLNHQG
jgi:hypothetical protein